MVSINDSKYNDGNMEYVVYIKHYSTITKIGEIKPDTELKEIHSLTDITKAFEHISTKIELYKTLSLTFPRNDLKKFLESTYHVKNIRQLNFHDLQEFQHIC